MTTQPFNHVGVLVEDLAEARARFSSALGLTFTEPLRGRSNGLVEEGRDPSPVEMTYCYSYEGPPHIELIQAVGDGIYSIEQGEGFHHLGYREGDLERTLATLEANGMAREATRREPADGDHIYTAFVTGLHGIRVELSTARRPGLLDRLAVAQADARRG